MQTIQKTRLTAEAEAIESAFDRDLRALRAERLTLETDCKAAEVQLLVMWQEYLLLADFSKRDDILAAKLDDKQTEHKVRSCDMLPSSFSSATSI